MMDNDSSSLILATLAFYFLTIIGLGLFYSRRAKSSRNTRGGQGSLRRRFPGDRLGSLVTGTHPAIFRLLPGEGYAPVPVHDLYRFLQCPL
jgi:hypothetical protein